MLIESISKFVKTKENQSVSRDSLRGSVELAKQGYFGMQRYVLVYKAPEASRQARHRQPAPANFARMTTEKHMLKLGEIQPIK